MISYCKGAARFRCQKLTAFPVNAIRLLHFEERPRDQRLPGTKGYLGLRLHVLRSDAQFFHHPIVHTVNTHTVQHNTTPTEEDRYSQHKNNGSEYWTHATESKADPRF